MEWHVVFLTNDQVRHKEHNQLRDHVSQIYLDENKPRDFALFSLNRNGSAAYYFTPVASEHCSTLIATYSVGVACDKPPVVPELKWEIGDLNAWQLFSSEAK